MPSATDIAAAIALLTGGGAVGGAVGRATAAVGPPVARGVAQSPLARAIILGNLANEAARIAEMQIVEEEGVDPGIAFSRGLQPLQREMMLLMDPKFRTGVERKVGVKRKVSKANKAVKHAMGLLRSGTKAATGADKGKLPRAAFKIATQAAGLANPGTKSGIGKGKTVKKALARKLKKWWK